MHTSSTSTLGTLEMQKSSSLRGNEGGELRLVFIIANWRMFILAVNLSGRGPNSATKAPRLAIIGDLWFTGFKGGAKPSRDVRQTLCDPASPLTLPKARRLNPVDSECRCCSLGSGYVIGAGARR